MSLCWVGGASPTVGGQRGAAPPRPSTVGSAPSSQNKSTVFSTLAIARIAHQGHRGASVAMGAKLAPSCLPPATGGGAPGSSPGCRVVRVARVCSGCATVWHCYPFATLWHVQAAVQNSQGHRLTPRSMPRDRGGTLSGSGRAGCTGVASAWTARTLPLRPCGALFRPGLSPRRPRGPAGAPCGVNLFSPGLVGGPRGPMPSKGDDEAECNQSHMMARARARP